MKPPHSGGRDKSEPVPGDRPLEIAFLVSEFPVLGQAFDEPGARELLSRGHRVRIYAMRPRANGEVDPATDDSARDPIFHLGASAHYLLGEIDRHRRWLERACTWVDNLATTPVRRLAQRAHAMCTSALQRLAWTADDRDLKRIAAELAPVDVLYAVHASNGLRALTLRNHGWRVGTFLTSFQATDFDHSSQRHDKNAVSELLRALDYALPADLDVSERLRALGCPPETIVETPSIPDDQSLGGARRREIGPPMNLGHDLTGLLEHAAAHTVFGSRVVSGCVLAQVTVVVVPGERLEHALSALRNLLHHTHVAVRLVFIDNDIARPSAETTTSTRSSVGVDAHPRNRLLCSPS